MKSKINMILGKRQIVIAALVFVLGIAIYLNWQFADDMTLGANGSVSNVNSKNYGDAQLVSESGDTYFVNAKLSRTKARDEAVETLNKILKGTSLDQKVITETIDKATKLAFSSEKENKIETLVKAKGYKECIALITGESINVIVKTDGLLPSDASKINDIIISQTKFAVENIKIVEVK